MSAPRRPGGDDRRPARRDRRGPAPRAPGATGDAAGPKPDADRPRVKASGGAGKAARADAPARPERDGRPTRPRTARTAAPDRPDRAAPGGRPPRDTAKPSRETRPPRPDRDAPRPARGGEPTGRSRKPAGPAASARATGPDKPARAGRPDRTRADGTASERPRRATRPGKPAPASAVPSGDDDGPNHRVGAAQRIAKLLARAGVASRREIERMIAEGRIALHGKVLDTPATTLTSLHGVTVDGKAVDAPPPARLFLFHKPTGLLTTERDPRGRPTIYDKLPADLPRVVPVGRLDLNTEGLLLLTTDGGLKRLLELPSSGIPRIYRARAYGDVTQDQLEALIEGVEIEGVRYGPIDANMERRTGRNVWIEMRLTEGKNREVRRVLEYLGLQVSRLIRVAYGPFVLGDMPVGDLAEVRQHDLVAFRKNMR